MERTFDQVKEDLAGSMDPFGKESISIRFAHLSLTMQTVDESFRKLIHEMYDPFVAGFSPHAEKLRTSGADRGDSDRTKTGARISCMRSQRERFLKVVPGEIYRIEFSEEENILFFWSYYFACRYDTEKREGILALCSGEKVNQRQVIENFMRVILAYLALHNGSFFLHSSGIVKDGKAHIFFGHSGAGKTTVVSLSKGMPLLSDDQVLVYLKDDIPFASGVPFSGGERFRKEADAIQVGNINEEFEIGGFYWLVKDNNTFLEPLSLVQASARLASSIPFIKDSPFPMQAALDLAAQIARRSKVYALHFRKDDSFLQVI